MRESTRPGLMPGVSVLGGAGAGFSYEAALRDALARRALPQQAVQAGMPPQQTQSMPSERAVSQQRRQQYY